MAPSSSPPVSAFLVLLLAPALGLLGPALAHRTSLHLPFVTENSLLTAEGSQGRTSFEALGHARVEVTRVSSSTLQPKEAVITRVLISGEPRALTLEDPSGVTLELHGWQLLLQGGRVSVADDGSFSMVPAAAILSASSVRGTAFGRPIATGFFKMNLPAESLGTVTGTFATIGTLHELLAATELEISARDVLAALGVPSPQRAERSLRVWVNVQALGSTPTPDFQAAHRTYAPPAHPKPMPTPVPAPAPAPV